ncbi:hypothetical protein, partial [Methylobacterium sp. E-066]|uniref:hypothetical protein n=1 Tax=Methylobacterium sp. E-066 TaxID=2836584 RepID=UPI001FBAAF81
EPDFATNQLMLLVYEAYARPNTQLPAYEWGLPEVNLPRPSAREDRVCVNRGRERGTQLPDAAGQA